MRYRSIFQFFLHKVAFCSVLGIVSISASLFKRGWAFCCAFPAFLLPMAGKNRQGPRKLRRWNPWSAGCGSCGLIWCFVRCLQFGLNLEELAHGVRPGHADILVLEYEEIAIPRPGLCLSFFRNKSRIAFLGTAPVSITSA